MPGQKNTQIESVVAHEILDSRGNPTVEAEVTLGGAAIRGSAPAGGYFSGANER